MPLVVEQRGQRRASPAEPGLDGALGHAHLAGDVVDGQVGDVVQHQRLALGLGQLAQRRDQGDVGLAGRRGLVGAASARSAGRRPRIVRRQRLTAIRYAVVRTQASGCSAFSSLRRCAQARTNASCTHSCASSRFPIMA